MVGPSEALGRGACACLEGTGALSAPADSGRVPVRTVAGTGLLCTLPSFRVKLKAPSDSDRSLLGWVDHGPGDPLQLQASNVPAMGDCELDC